MSKQNDIYGLIVRVRLLMNDLSYKKAIVAKDTAFTRKRKQTFAGIISMILRGLKQGLTKGIREAVEEELALQELISKQAFSKQRMLLKPEALRRIFEESVNHAIEHDLTERYKGYRLLAIDGTMYNLPNTQELEEKYGAQRSNRASQVQAKGSCLMDVTSKIILDTAFTPYGTNERTLAMEHIEFLAERGLTDSLVIMDRGYPSFELINAFEEKGLHYLMRSTDQFFKEVNEAKETDSTITRKKRGKEIRIRVIKISVNGGEETLLTNVMESDFGFDDFKELYWRRWEIETGYNILKNTIEIEKFSGRSEITILQDFYADMFLKNAAQMAIWTDEKEIRKRNRERERKYDYKINVNAAVSALRGDLIALIMEPSAYKRKRRLKALQKELISKVVAIRPGRYFGELGKPRKAKHPGYKYPHNRRN